MTLNTTAGVQAVEQRLAVLLDREDELAAAGVDEFGGGLDSMQRVRGRRHRVQVEAAEPVTGG